VGADGCMGRGVLYAGGVAISHQPPAISHQPSARAEEDRLEPFESFELSERFGEKALTTFSCQSSVVSR